MIFLKFEEVETGRALVVAEHYAPDELPEEQKAAGVLVEALPAKTDQPGKHGVLYINPDTLELWYEYVDVPVPEPPVDPVAEVGKLEQQINLLQRGVEVDLTLVQKEQVIREKITACQITAENFATLPVEEQELVKLVLFKDYSPTKEDVPKALSAVEFGLVALFKLLGKAIDRTKLTEQEQDFLDAFVGVVSLNDMPINDTTDWRFQYFKQQFEGTQQNRQEYFNKKVTITGTI